MQPSVEEKTSALSNRLLVFSTVLSRTSLEAETRRSQKVEVVTHQVRDLVDQLDLYAAEGEYHCREAGLMRRSLLVILEHLAGLLREMGEEELATRVVRIRGRAKELPPVEAPPGPEGLGAPGSGSNR